MFSLRQKREIADNVQRILRETGHPELPEGEINFSLYVVGVDAESWANIRNNGRVQNPGVNPWNESQDVPPKPGDAEDMRKIRFTDNGGPNG